MGEIVDRALLRRMSSSRGMDKFNVLRDAA